MAVPRNRLSNARKNIRRSHHAKEAKNLVKCINCSSPKIPHCICQSCGAYGERVIINKEISGE
ncbi:MAG: 50S ribosomal protein L32 [Chlamydiae bacterium]|nr:50S ribosomal protein L32 [Chlamydiota bacterium]